MVASVQSSSSKYKQHKKCTKMIFKIITVAAVLSVVYAQKQQASSYSSISFHGGDVHQNDHQAAPLHTVQPYSAPSIVNAAAYHQSAAAAAYQRAPAAAAYQPAPVAAAYQPAPAAAAYQAAPAHNTDYPAPHPHYVFEYGVNDVHTHDVHNQHEERDGDVVKGVYSLVQPDGVTRTVHYTADHHNGFNAQVEYTGHAAHPQQAQKAVAAAPVYQAQAPVHQAVAAAPVYHAQAPAQHTVAAAPVYHAQAAVQHTVAAAPVYHAQAPVHHAVAAAPVYHAQAPVHHTVAAAPVYHAQAPVHHAYHH